MINNCCPSIKLRLDEYVESAVTGNSNALMTACFGSRPPQSIIGTCPMVNKFVSIAQDEDFQKYINALTTAASNIQIPTIRAQRQCSSTEAYATLCDWTQREHIESCERKTLLYVAQHNSDNDYQIFVQQAKKNLRLLIDAITRAFPKKNVISTTTSTTTVDLKTNNASPTSTQPTACLFITILALLFSVFLC
jgi:hypothetical protein